MEKALFPKDFTWGAASASYQIEGAYQEDGRGESIWDRFSHIQDGRVENGDTGDVACDFYHRYPEDIGIAKKLGIQSLRYSIAWSRIFPEGRGQVNQKGLDFYRRFTEDLVKNGIKPCVTLFHWDLPQALQDIGGWTNRDISGYFSDYAETMYKALGDIVPDWVTINETYIYTTFGFMRGLHAPGLRDFNAALLAGHNLMRSHGAAVQAFRGLNLAGKIGIANNYRISYPATQSAEDVAAAERQYDYHVRWFTDPLFGKGYPESLTKWFAANDVRLPKIKTGDMELMAEPMDFLGFNTYSSEFMAHDEGVWPLKVSPRLSGRPYTECIWEVHPQALYDLLKRLDQDYDHPALKITENGSAWKDMVNRYGRVSDDNRSDYLYSHLLSCQKAIKEGVNLNAYYVWSLTDNYEWAAGYSIRFGITYIDYATQKRIIKDSGYYYQDVIRNNGVEIVG